MLKYAKSMHLKNTVTSALIIKQFYVQNALLITKTANSKTQEINSLFTIGRDIDECVNKQGNKSNKPVILKQELMLQLMHSITIRWRTLNSFTIHSISFKSTWILESLSCCRKLMNRYKIFNLHLMVISSLYSIKKYLKLNGCRNRKRFMLGCIMVRNKNYLLIQILIQCLQQQIKSKSKIKEFFLNGRI